MATGQRDLYLGLADFAEPTLLLIGQPANFSWLAAQLANRRAFCLEGVSANPPVSLHMVPTDREGCLTCEAHAFEWRITIVESQIVAGQLQELAAAAQPAHAYLDPVLNSTKMQIMASCGEYEPGEIFGTR